MLLTALSVSGKQKGLFQFINLILYKFLNIFNMRVVVYETQPPRFDSKNNKTINKSPARGSLPCESQH